MTWRKYFKPVNSILPVSNTSQTQGMSAAKFSSWLPEIYQGPPNRLQRYAQYDQMDFDHEVHGALDIIAEFSTQPHDDSGLPFIIKHRQEPSGEEAKIISTLLGQWCRLNKLDKRMFKIFRSTLKYGDQFFIRDPETWEMYWIDPSTVEKVMVNESKGKKIECYYVKDLDPNFNNLVATNVNRRQPGSANAFPGAAPSSGAMNYGTGAIPVNYTGNGTNNPSTTPAFPVDAKHIIHISLSEGMDDAWPFGISELEKIYKIYKQKELIEEALIIYRVHRAPERRLFQIDTGSMPPQKAQQYIERVKNEVQQKRIPSRNGGGLDIMDSAYNPMSILEDYFFAVSSDGRGSKVEVLPGGSNLGEIDDVKYFNNKMLRALGIPSSYLPTGPEDGTNIVSDGRVGTAFIQEFRFQKACQRLQAQLSKTFDDEFKKFVKKKGYSLDFSTFEVEFTEPQNFSEYRQIEIDNQRAAVFSQVSAVPFISKRMALKKYLGWTHEEIHENERLWREEKGVETQEDKIQSNEINSDVSGLSGGMPMGDITGGAGPGPDDDDLSTDETDDLSDDLGDIDDELS